MSKRVAVIIGAGPAGLTAAYELLTRSDIKPIVLEQSPMLGGLAQTVNFKGNRIDIGGHRFFSKSDRVMEWWLEMLPLEKLESGKASVVYQRKKTTVHAGGKGLDPQRVDKVMLLRPRRSRIYYLRKFFDYPITLSLKTMSHLGLHRTIRIGCSYLRARLCPIRDERNLEHFFINRFGHELYTTFFKSYTEKVWGVSCQQISAAWGAQRIKGLSISKALLHALKAPFKKRSDVKQKGTETSLIEQFLYPKYGPGQMWETCAKKVEEMGGQVITCTQATALEMEGQRVRAVEVVDSTTHQRRIINGDYVFSTMPVKDLVRALGKQVPDRIRTISEGLVYRDFITVGLLLDKLVVHEESQDGRSLIKDTWIYIQEPDVLVGRLQIFNNWSPYMVADSSKVWVGLEYFCDEGDELWERSDEQLIKLGQAELAKIGIIDPGDVLDATVLRMAKTYPAYFGTFDRFDELRDYVDDIENLFLIGRNGIHRYNNQDHSMLAAMTAVDNILAGRKDKSNIWSVNAEADYHEQVSPDKSESRPE